MAISFGAISDHKLITEVQPISVTWSWSAINASPAYPTVNYDMVEIPPGQPFIGRGSHRVNLQTAHGMRVGCTMEMVSALAGERWTDHPATAEPGLTKLMIRTNDMLPDRARQEMLELVPRLLDTNGVTFDWDLEKLLRQSWQQAEVIGHQAVMDARVVDPSGARFLLGNARDLLDEFDRRLGRPTPKLDDQVLTQLMMALAA
jgi:hypothetical protein